MRYLYNTAHPNPPLRENLGRGNEKILRDRGWEGSGKAVAPGHDGINILLNFYQLGYPTQGQDELSTF